MNRKTYTIDAADKAIGRIATEAVMFLRGKNEPNFEFHQDNGSFVVVKNISKTKFTGKKLKQKNYYHYSGYQGGLKTKKMGEVFESDPGEVLRRAVYNMLPKNRLRPNMIKRLKTI
ncbi:50S ribosomal protein L13 [Candidatus Parcubacteria bacterium]|nr:50S ribosomal protein L13 [Candidatus Parcubacteria bacterium]